MKWSIASYMSNVKDENPRSASISFDDNATESLDALEHLFNPPAGTSDKMRNAYSQYRQKLKESMVYSKGFTLSIARNKSINVSGFENVGGKLKLAVLDSYLLQANGYYSGQYYNIDITALILTVKNGKPANEKYSVRWTL